MEQIGLLFYSINEDLKSCFLSSSSLNIELPSLLYEKFEAPKKFEIYYRNFLKFD